MIKVLGIGSPFGDDQIAWRIVKLLQQSEGLKPYDPHILQIEPHDRPGVRLLHLMEGAAIVFLIDAMVSGHPPGTLHRFENEAIEILPDRVSTHDLGLAHTLQLGRSLNQLPAHIVLYGIEIDVQQENGFQNRIQTNVLLKMKEQIENELISLLTLDRGLP